MKWLRKRYIAIALNKTQGIQPAGYYFKFTLSGVINICAN